MKDALEYARDLKEQAKTYIALAVATKDQTLFDEALELLEEARALVQSELTNLEGADASNRLLQDRLTEAAAEMADCFGIAGGAYRKWGLLSQAIGMYDEGCKYEENAAYGIQNSYNMVNSIVLRVTNDSSILKTLKGKIAVAIEVVKGQIDKSRRRDWWAWADLGLLYILTEAEDLAVESYRKIRDLGAKEEHIDTIADVISQLQLKVQGSHPRIAHIIQQCIFRLKEDT